MYAVYRSITHDTLEHYVGAFTLKRNATIAAKKALKQPHTTTVQIYKEQQNYPFLALVDEFRKQ